MERRELIEEGGSDEDIKNVMDSISAEQKTFLQSYKMARESFDSCLRI